MSNEFSNSTLSLVGAGPGDPELITLKGIKAIQKADVILYDALASKDLLEYAKNDCKIVYVGKRKGKQAYNQDEINQLIVRYAGHYTNVLRLKGGDPFVFGRGHEEMEYALKYGIRVAVIPGISSAISAPASAGIPLTKRGVNESFWVITGTLANGAMAADLQLAAQSTATLIVLMGMSKLTEIITVLQATRGHQEPVAIIQHATLPGQKIIRGTAGTIQDIANHHTMESPTVIVIGKVVAESLLMEQVQCIFTEPLLKMAM